MFTLKEIINHAPSCKCTWCEINDLLQQSPNPEVDLETWLKQKQYEEEINSKDAL